MARPSAISGLMGPSAAVLHSAISQDDPWRRAARLASAIYRRKIAMRVRSVTHAIAWGGCSGADDAGVARGNVRSLTERPRLPVGDFRVVF